MAKKLRHAVFGFLILAIIFKKISTNEVDNEILQVDKEIENEFGDFFKNKRCCPDSKLVDAQKKQSRDGIGGTLPPGYKLFNEEIVCQAEGEKVMPGMEICNDGSYQEYIMGSKLYKFTVSGTKLKIKNNCDTDAEEVVIDQSTDNFCVGLKDLKEDDDINAESDEEDIEDDYGDDDNLTLFEDQNSCLLDGATSSKSSSTKYAKVIKYCPKPCGAYFRKTDPMCIRTCLCPKNYVFTKEGSCRLMNATIRDLITKNVNKTWKGGMKNWSPDSRSQRNEVFEIGMGIDPTKNIAMANTMRRDCPAGYKKRYLSPKDKCNDQFTIGTGHFNHMACTNQPLKTATNAEVKMKIHNEHLNHRDTINWFGGDCDFNTSEGLFVDEFCLNILEDGSFTAEICEKISDAEQYKFRYYPIVLITSSIFLSVTFCIYTAKKHLLDHLTRIMRHYAFNMLVAFLVLSINQAFDIKGSSEVGCVIIGILQQFFFLAAFIFMTIMSYETFKRIRKTIDISNRRPNSAVFSLVRKVSAVVNETAFGSSQSLLGDVMFRKYEPPENELPRGDRIRRIKRYGWEVCSAYSISALITLLAIIINFLPYSYVERCDSFRPRFGESQCFFSDRLNKAYWFYLPVGISILFNLIIFFAMIGILCKVLCSSDASHGGRAKYICGIFTRYIILMGGIGVIWCFEIFSGIFADDPKHWKWIVFDVVNMLQGVWIFILFVVFNPEAKKLFRRATPSTEGDTTKIQEIALSEVETQTLVQSQ